MLTRSEYRILICILVLFFLTFGQVGARPAPAGLRKSNVEVIVNLKTPVPPAGQRKRLVFKEELSIGQKEGDENAQFGSAVFFNTDEKGNFYVTDWDKKRILKFDPSGKYVLTIGRKGQGPGEFQNLTPVRFDKEGNIYVTDIANRRTSFFSRQGNYLRQIPLPEVFEDLYITAKGSYVSSRSIPSESGTGMAYKVVDGFFNDKFELVTQFYSRVVDFKFPSGRDATSIAKFEAGILSTMAFQASALHLLAADDTIYFGCPQNYIIDVYSPEGHKTGTIGRAFDPIKVTDKDKAYFAATVARPFLTQPGFPTTEDQIKNVLKFIEYPDTKPAYQYFTPMENGWLVVLVDFAAGEDSLFDIFDQNGRYIGQFKAHFPADHGWFFFKNGKVYDVETDEDGYKFVKRYGFKIEDY